MSELKSDLIKLQLDMGALKLQACSEDDQKRFKELEKTGQSLPPDIHKNDVGVYCRYVNKSLDVTEEEISQFIPLMQLKYLKTIKNCMVFFTALTVIAIVVYLVLFFIAAM